MIRVFTIRLFYPIPADLTRAKRVKSATKSTLKNQLRIIGGKWRGRKLDFPSVDGLRPTGDRIRETLFNWLAPDIVDARCLDLFAGSGALGFEAASRGADSVVMIETNRTAYTQLVSNCSTLNADSIDLICTDALDWLAKTPLPAESPSTSKPFDIVFLDPPFEKQLFNKTIALLDASNLVTDMGLIYLETPRDHLFTTPKHWRKHKEKHAGQVSAYVFINANEA